MFSPESVKRFHWRARFQVGFYLRMFFSQMDFSQDQSLKIWENAGYKVPYIPYTYKHVFALEARYWDPHKAHRFILDHWHFSILIVIAYVFVR